MRVVTWNMGMALDAFAPVHDRAWHFLLALDPDVALVQEARPPDWVRQIRAVHAEPYELWASAIVTKDLPLAPVAHAPTDALGHYGSYVATAAVTVPGVGEVTVASVHATAKPAFSSILQGLDSDAIRRPSVSEPWMNDVAYVGLREFVRERPFLVGGDWNLARLFDEVYGAQMGGKEFFDRAASDGWVECQWRLHGRETQTWLREGDRPYQLDHVFCDPGLGKRLIACEAYVEPVQRLGLSDHAPLVIDFVAPD